MYFSHVQTKGPRLGASQHTNTGYVPGYAQCLLALGIASERQHTHRSSFHCVVILNEMHLNALKISCCEKRIE